MNQELALWVIGITLTLGGFLGAFILKLVFTELGRNRDSLHDCNNRIQRLAGARELAEEIVAALEERDERRLRRQGH